MLNKFTLIEDQLETMNSLQLVETLNFLQNNYNIIGSVHNISDDKLDDIEKIFLNENKQELVNKINILLVKHPEWDEFLNPVLNELSYNTVTIDYINDKITLINELENDQTDKNYKQEVNNLCLYLKSELEIGNINLGEIKNNQLVELINTSLSLFNEENDIDWQEYLETINQSCEEIYKD